MQTPLCSIASMLIVACATAAAGTATIQWQFGNYTTQPAAGARVVITPIAPSTNGTMIVIGDRRTFTNDVTGSLIVSNVIVPASYQVQLFGPYGITTITNSFPDTNGFINAGNFISPYVGNSGYGLFSGSFGGNAAGLSNANASALFGSGVIPSQYLPAGTGGGSATNAISNNGGSGTNTTLRGTTTVDSLVATNLIGNGSGLSQVPAASVNPFIGANLNFFGDSQTDDLLNSAPGVPNGLGVINWVSWPNYLTNDPVVAGYSIYKNEARSGACMTNVYPSETAQILRGTNNWNFEYEGINDLVYVAAGNMATWATSKSNVWLQLITNAADHLVVLTLPSYSAGCTYPNQIGSTCQVARLQINDWMRKQASQMSLTYSNRFYLVDVARIIDDASDTNYVWTDGLHLMNPGRRTIVSAIKAAVIPGAYLIQAPQSPLVAPAGTNVAQAPGMRWGALWLQDLFPNYTPSGNGLAVGYYPSLDAALISGLSYPAGTGKGMVLDHAAGGITIGSLTAPVANTLNVAYAMAAKQLNAYALWVTNTFWTAPTGPGLVVAYSPGNFGIIESYDYGASSAKPTIFDYDRGGLTFGSFTAPKGGFELDVYGSILADNYGGAGVIAAAGGIASYPNFPISLMGHYDSGGTHMGYIGASHDSGGTAEAFAVDYLGGGVTIGALSKPTAGYGLDVYGNTQLRGNVSLLAAITGLIGNGTNSSGLAFNSIGTVATLNTNGNPNQYLNSAGGWTSPGAGSQTPWSSMINGAGNGLSNVGFVSSSGPLTNTGASYFGSSGQAKIDASGNISGPGVSITGIQGSNSVGFVMTNLYTNNGTFTWYVPTNAIAHYIVCIGAGGGGGSGGTTNTTTGMFGGGGGQGGSINWSWILPPQIGAPSTAVTITVGQGGSGGNAQATQGKSGNNGVNGGASSFGAFIVADGGAAGSGGTTATGTGGTTGGSVHNYYVIGANGGSSATNGAASTGSQGATGSAGGGGGGGGQNFTGTAYAGGTGCMLFYPYYIAAPTGGTINVSTTANAGSTHGNFMPDGAGGGAGSGACYNDSNNSGAGGAGGWPGGGGGGSGGVSGTTHSSGAGGAGANGLVMIVTWVSQ
jgi:hypothetical protein